MNAIILFPSSEYALGLYNDADYQEAKRIRPPREIGPPNLQGHGDADVARSRRCGVSLTCQQTCYALYLVM
jgi:hypothetical protein